MEWAEAYLDVAFTTKSHLATECGTMAHIKDGVTSEATMKTSLPCLPDLLRSLDGSFRSSKFIVSTIRCSPSGTQSNRA